MDNELFITKKPGQLNDTDFQQLQKSALETIQRLAGNVWTDFNEHDPGVTIMDALNYALAELDYKCSFPLEDYLNNSEGVYAPDEYGLFRPDQVYPTAPITERDYCKLIFDSVEEIAGIWMIKAESSLPGMIDLVVDLIPTINESELGSIHQKIFKLYHQNRNLCENLNKIHFRSKEKLELVGEIELDEDADASEILAKAYFTCSKYFNPGMKYLDMREHFNSDADWSALLDGPLLANGIIDDNSVVPPKTNFFISDIHYQLRTIKGVKVVRNFYLAGHDEVYSDEIQCNDILHSYTVNFPSSKNGIQLLLLKGKKEAKLSFEEVVRWYKRLIIDEYGNQNQYAGLKGSFNFPKGNFNNFSEYSSLQNDFPNFYGINRNGIPGYYDNDRKARAKQLKGYLLGFDLAIASSMYELEVLHQLLNIKQQLPVAKIPDLSNTVSLWNELFDSNKIFEEPAIAISNKLEIKKSLFDLLDSFYGEKSLLPFADEFDVYHSMRNRKSWQIEQRATFLQNEPSLIHSRACAFDITDERPENVAGLKKWIALLFGFNDTFDLPVTNVFSKFALRLLSDKEFYNDLKGLLNIDFVINKLDENFMDEMVFDIPEMQVPNPIDNYKEFSSKIYLLNHNFIFESFLRNGIRIENYKIVQPEDKLYLLAYHSEEQSEWVGLGRFETMEEAGITANQLRDFLIFLNRQSENFYLVEHLLLSENKADDGYTLRVSYEEKILFSLLKPVSRNEIFFIKNTIEKALENPDKFTIREAENERYVIYLETGEKNALYCKQTFVEREKAADFLEKELSGYNLEVEIFYQRSDDLLLPVYFMDFGMTVVLPNWSARFHNKKFQSWCEELIEERCPAHIKLHFLWLPAPAIRQFEKLYFAWRSAMVSGIALYEKSVDLTSFLKNHLHPKHGKNN